MNFYCEAVSILDDKYFNEWMQLWKNSKLKHFFNSPQFFRASLDAFGFEEYVIIFCYNDGKLNLVLPLVRQRIFGLSCYTSPARRGNYIDKLPLLIIEGCSPEVIEKSFAVARNLGNICLPEINEDEMHYLKDELAPSFIRKVSIARYLNLDDETDILQYMSLNRRRSLMKKIEAQTGRIEFKVEGIESMNKVISIEKQSCKYKQKKALFSSDRSLRLMTSLMKHTPESFKIGVFYLDNKPIATTLGFTYEKTFCGYHMSFNDNFKSFEPGKITFYYTLKYLQTEGFRVVDFSRGDSELKREFATMLRIQYDAYWSKNKLTVYYWMICTYLVLMLKYIFSNRRKPFIFAKMHYDKVKYHFKLFIKNRAIKQSKLKKKTRKQLIFSNYDDLKNPWYGGGGARSIHEVAKCLVRNFDVVVITGRYPRSKSEKISGVYYQRIGISFLGPKFGQLIFSALLPFYAIFRNYDAWIDSLTPPFGASLMPLMTNKPVIGLVHMLPATDMKRKYGIPFHVLESLGLKFYKYFSVLTEEMQKTIKEHNDKASLIVIPNGVNFPGMINLDPKHFLFLGRIEVDQKGIDLLIAAFEKLNSTSKKLVIAGAGAEAEVKRMDALIKASICPNHIDYVGKAEGQIKANLIQQAKAVIIPSRHETFSMVALEALSYGVPIIIFDIRNLNWIPKECAIRVKPFSIEDLARSIEIIETRRQPKEMALELEKFARKFDWKIISQQYSQFLNSIIKKNESG